ncbi:MAG: polyprenyl diphosphate synthase [Longimicrobiales bacterium]
MKGLHVAIIMDGNGRWATQRGLPRTAGHRRGADAVRRVVEAAPDLGVHALTLYAFSSDNWERPAGEVRTLMRLLRRYLRTETPELVENGVRLKVIGRRDRLQPGIVAAIEQAEKATAHGDRLLLRLAIDYSARDALVLAAAKLANGAGTANGKARGTANGAGEPGPFEGLSRERLADAMGEVLNMEGAATDVDLLIRTGGEQRLSDFLLWECAYAELVFTDRLWPDFEARDLDAAIAEFGRRERRYGRVLRQAV